MTSRNEPLTARYRATFNRLLDDEQKLFEAKNHDYAHGGNPMGNFHRVAEILSLYPNLSLSRPVVVALCYLLKQLDATCWLLSSGHTAQSEGIQDRIRDIAIYAKLMMILEKEERDGAREPRFTEESCGGL